ncbi:hypothetical protein EnteroDNA1_02528 [Enterobacter sp. HK169]|nr:hypothetical protein EnteroDNA1_02528 [Enterobacter sp. HK169]
MGAVGVMVIAIVAGGFWLVTSSKPQPATASAAEAAPPQEMRETPSSRETLTRMGVTWDENNFRSAINRNDTRVTLLFLQGGMDWKLSWTEEAMSAGYDDVLELMLRYRQNMVEEKPCRRFINTLSHAMSNGESLTSVRKEYLKAFCTVPAVVKRQQHDLDMATRRAQSQPDATTKKWQSIQTAIYEVIR